MQKRYYMTIHYKKNDKIVCNGASFYAESTNDITKVTCGSCKRVIEGDKKLKELRKAKCEHNNERGAYRHNGN